MSYCIQTDLEAAIDQEALVQLTDDECTGSVDATRLERAVVDASALIDGYLRGRYVVPLTTVPPLVRKLCVDMSIHGLYARRPSMGIPQGIQDRYKSALEVLRGIRDGSMDLGVEPPPSESTAIIADTDGPDRLFTADTMEDF